MLFLKWGNLFLCYRRRYHHNESFTISVLTTEDALATEESEKEKSKVVLSQSANISQEVSVDMFADGGIERVYETAFALCT